MSTVLISCGALEDEIRKAASNLNNPPELIFLEAGLHSKPTGQMQSELQKQLDSLPEETALVLFGYGLCGGSMNGLTTGNFTLVIPRVDDCIPLLLGSREKVKQASKIPSFFLTNGWLKFSNKFYYDTLGRLGEKRTAKAYKMLLANYKRFLFIDTGAYDLKQAQADMADRISRHNLPADIMPGDISWLTELITGPWPDEKFLTVSPNSRVHIENMDIRNALSKPL